MRRRKIRRVVGDGTLHCEGPLITSTVNPHLDFVCANWGVQEIEMCKSRLAERDGNTTREETASFQELGTYGQGRKHRAKALTRGIIYQWLSWGYGLRKYKVMINQYSKWWQQRLYFLHKDSIAISYSKCLGLFKSHEDVIIIFQAEV